MELFVGQTRGPFLQLDAGHDQTQQGNDEKAGQHNRDYLRCKDTTNLSVWQFILYRMPCSIAQTRWFVSETCPRPQLGLNKMCV